MMELQVRHMSEPAVHTAEHLLNQTMVRLFGCPRSKNAHNLLAECPTEAQVADIEVRINALIESSLPVTVEFMSKEEAASYQK